MKKYNVYQQGHPLEIVDGKDGPFDWKLNIQKLGTVMAETGAAAIAKARRTLKEFKMAPRNTLAAYPIVEEIK